MASSPAIVVCTACYMYSLSVSVGDEGFTYDKYREIVRLTEKILELETRIQTLVEDNEKDALGSAFIDILNSIAVRQPVSGPTHCRNHTLDLIL